MLNQSLLSRLMGMVGIMSSKGIDFKWLSVAYTTLFYITTLWGILN